MPLDELTLALAIGLPIVLVAAANVYLAMTDERGALKWGRREPPHPPSEGEPDDPARVLPGPNP